MSVHNRTPKAVLFAPGLASWVEVDLEILSRFASVHAASVLNLSPLGVAKNLSRILKSDVCIFWFGSFRHLPYLMFAKLALKPVVIIAGGYDVSRFDQIGYGAFSSGVFSRWGRRALFASADRVLAVSNAIHAAARVNLHVAEKNIETVRLGFRTSKRELLPWGKRKPQVVFLISAPDDAIQVKGIDRIVPVCRRLPEVKFVVAGRLGPEARRLLTAEPVPNLKAVGWLEYEGREFVDLLNTSRVVCLLSRTESFGAALIDGALQGCVPVAFEVGAIPEVIAGIGRVVPCTEDESANLEAVSQAIQQVVSLPENDVEQTRQKALDRFSISIRAKRLREIVTELVS